MHRKYMHRNTSNDTFSGNNTFSGSNSFTGSNSFSQTNTGSITGNAATATLAVNATSAGTVANALDLGGVVATNYARLDIGNSFSGNQAVTGNVSVTGNSSTTGTVTIGSGGTPIVEHLSVLVNPSIPALMPLMAHPSPLR
jgi:hypothetical protein